MIRSRHRLILLAAGPLLMAAGCAAPFRAAESVAKMVTDTTLGVAKTGAQLAGQGAQAASGALPAAALMGLQAEGSQQEPNPQP